MVHSCGDMALKVYDFIQQAAEIRQRSAGVAAALRLATTPPFPILQEASADTFAIQIPAALAYHGDHRR